jgi:hypothetical protein
VSLLKEEVVVLCLDSCMDMRQEPESNVSQTQDLSQGDHRARPTEFHIGDKASGRV